MAPQPLVTGVSPKEGPPGTRVTIRGENLGNDPRDLIGIDRLEEIDLLFLQENGLCRSYDAVRCHCYWILF